MSLSRLSTLSKYSCKEVYSCLRKIYTGNPCDYSYCAGLRTISRKFDRTLLVPGTKSIVHFNHSQNSNYCSAGNGKTLSAKEKLKQVVKDYGTTIVVFHVTISLASLGCCYLIIYSGLNITDWLEKMNISSNQQMANVTGGVSTFVIAYAVHKVFAPVRIGITLSVAPILVRYLRKIGVLKVRKK